MFRDKNEEIYKIQFTLVVVSYNNRSYKNMLKIVWYQKICDKHFKNRKNHHITLLFRCEVP